MAKPTGWSTDSAIPPNIGEQHQESYQVSAQRPRRRWRPSGRTPGPSSGVLSLLATIAAASSTADGSPLTVPLTPPSFLCPFIEHDSCYANTDISSSASTAKRASVVLPPTPAKSKRKVVQIADKFEKDSDGKWRKVDAYTLYGSTICLQNCQSSGTPDGVNNAINPATPTTLPSTVSQSSDKYAATMPTGWSTSASYDKPRTTVILCVSLILAFFMCAFMTAFVFWRRKQQKLKEGDEEMKLRRRRGQDLSEQETLMKKEARLKQKFWARASARWKANTQSSARRRKNRRLLAAVQSMSACDHSRPESLRRAPSRSSSTSPTPTHRSSLSSDNRSAHVDGHATLGPSISTPNTGTVAPSPPAYIQTDSPPPTRSKHNHADETYLHTDHEPPDPFSPIPHHTNDHEGHPQFTPSTDDVLIPYDDSYHVGHVATDDKTLLAHMATMASAPPVEPDEGGSSTLQTSAPVWDDEQLEDIIDGLDDTEIGPSHTSSPPPSLPSTSHSLFPPPPSKGKMVAPDFYDYPYSFEEDVSTLEPEMGPSAPPFEEHTPSAPPCEELEMKPSAPPLMQEFLPSAPDWEDGEGGQDHDREESPHQHSSRPPSPASISATSYSVLPSYHA